MPLCKSTTIYTFSPPLRLVFTLALSIPPSVPLVLLDFLLLSHDLLLLFCTCTKGIALLFMLSNVSLLASVREPHRGNSISIVRIRRAILSRRVEGCETLTFLPTCGEKIELFFEERRNVRECFLSPPPFSLALSIDLYQPELRWAPSFLLYANAGSVRLNLIWKFCIGKFHHTLSSPILERL